MENVSSRCGNRDNAPRLRFPEFNGEWMEKKIKEFANCYAGATPSTKERKYWENGTIPWLSSGEVNKKHISFTDNFITKIGYDSCSTKMIPANTVVMALAGQGKTRGTVAITEIELCTNQSLASIVTNETVDDKFLLYYLETQYSNLRAISSGDGTRGGLNLNIINEYSVFLASPPEQKKIAAFFTLLDSRIQKQRQLVESLKTYKRGVMNKLFDENIEFDKYLKWEKVEEIFKTINDKPYQVQSCSYFQNGLYDIVDQGKKEIVGFCDYNDKLFIDVPVIIYGDHTTLVKYREKKFIVGGDGVKLLKSRNSNINLKYLYYALLRYNIKLEGYKRHFSILKEVSLPIFEKCIQDEIAKIMTCIDSYIKLHENKLSSLLSLKSSLLQKMFI